MRTETQYSSTPLEYSQEHGRQHVTRDVITDCDHHPASCARGDTKESKSRDDYPLFTDWLGWRIVRCRHLPLFVPSQLADNRFHANALIVHAGRCRDPEPHFPHCRSVLDTEHDWSTGQGVPLSRGFMDDSEELVGPAWRPSRIVGSLLKLAKLSSR